MDVEIDSLEIKTKIKDEQQHSPIHLQTKNMVAIELLIEKHLERKIREMVNN